MCWRRYPRPDDYEAARRCKGIVSTGLRVVPQSSSGLENCPAQPRRHSTPERWRGEIHSNVRISTLLTFENHCLEEAIDFWRPLRRLWRGYVEYAMLNILVTQDEVLEEKKVERNRENITNSVGGGLA